MPTATVSYSQTCPPALTGGTGSGVLAVEERATATSHWGVASTVAGVCGSAARATMRTGAVNAWRVTGTGAAHGRYSPSGAGTVGGAYSGAFRGSVTDVL